MESWWRLIAQAAGALILAIGLIASYLYLHSSRVKSRRDKERILRESDRRYGRLFNTVSDAVYVHDLQGTFLDVNQAAARLIGQSVESVVGQSMRSVLGPGQPDAITDYLGRLQRGARSVDGIMPLVSKAQSKVIVLEFRSSLLLEGDQAIRVQGIARDVTAQKAFERSLRKRERQMQRLLVRAEAMQEELRAMSQELVNTQEEERRRISRELHDEVGQLLAAMTLNLELMKKHPSAREEASLRRQIQDAEKLASEMFGRIRKVLQDLRPVVLDESGIIGSIRLMLTDYAERTGLTTLLNEDVPDVDQLSNEKKTVLYRIVQESLTNVSKHAHAHAVSVDLRRVEGQVVLSIADDGDGFSVDAPRTSDRRRKGMGLVGMKERVSLVHGEFRVESAVGRGTSILARIPIADAGKAGGTLN